MSPEGLTSPTGSTYALGMEITESPARPSVWCQTHAETVRQDGLVPATKVDPFGRSQCHRCWTIGRVLRGEDR